MKIFFLLACLLLFNTILFSQQADPDDNRIVARAGNDKITAEEFKDRFDFSPHPRKSESLDTSLIKREYLYTLIAEKLLAQKAKDLNLDTAQDVNGILSYLEKLFVRDAYYKKEISGKVKVSLEDMEEGEERYSKLLVAKYLYSEDQNNIEQLFEELKRGASIDSLLINRPEYEEQQTPGTVTFGTLDKKIEDPLYNLKPGEFTHPIKTGNRWYIFKLIETVINPDFGNENTKVKIRKIIEDRKTEKLANDFLYNFLHTEKVEVDKALFFKIADLIERKVNEKRLNNKDTNLPYVILGEGDFEDIMDSLGKNNLKKTFIKFQHDPEAVNEFLTQLGYGSFKVDSAGIRDVTWVFNKYVKDYIQNELLVRAAYKQGMQNLPIVKNDKKIWADYYLSQKLERMIYDSITVSDNEAYEYYTKNYNMAFYPDEVHVKEILTDSLDKIEDALKEINNGLSFENVAEKYSIIDPSKEKGGDMGYFPVTSHGEIGKVSAQMKTGDIYGPVKTSRGYALIKLIDKRKSRKPVDTSFTNIKDEIIGIKKGIELRKKLKKYVAALAAEYGVKINTGIFDSIPVTQLNTITVRMIGFGGRIYAFPYQPLFSDWFEAYKSLEKKIP
jgi:peptidyl-prolyl cis-trans isomerase C